MLTIFGNLRINNVIRLQHFKDSFNSFCKISDNWLINIRGTFRDEALNFLREKLGDKLVEFSLLDDSRGWAKNGLEMMEKAKHNYILVWNEDHLNIAPQELYQGLVKEMAKERVDLMYYSWWCDGKLRMGLENLPMKKLDNIDTIELTKDSWQTACQAGHFNYLVSMVSIFEKDFFKKMLTAETRKLPGFMTALVNKSIFWSYRIICLLIGRKKFVVNNRYFNFINKYLFSFRLPNFPKETPFDMEKNSTRTDLLPFKIALPRQELFVSIDYDVFPGYSLISRGLYVDRNGGQLSLKQNIGDIMSEINNVLSKINEKEVESLTQEILSAQRVFLAGAGRVGLAARGFAMRLAHLGLEAYTIGDMNVPAIKNHDLLLISSGSGETQTIYDIETMAKKNGSRIALITGNLNSRMAKLADLVMEISAPSKVKSKGGFQSIQPMTTLNEQCLCLFFDALVLKLMEELNETHDTMWARHSNLE